MIATARVNEYLEQHGFDPAADRTFGRTLCGQLLSTMVIIEPDIKFGSTSVPLCQACAASAG